MKHVSKPREMPYTALNSVILLYLIDLKKKKKASLSRVNFAFSVAPKTILCRRNRMGWKPRGSTTIDGWWLIFLADFDGWQIIFKPYDDWN